MNAGKELYFSVLPEQDGFRVDLFLQKMVPEYTRSFLQKSIDKGEVLINGKPVSKSAKVKTGDSVFLCVPEPVDDTAKPEAIPLNIVYEDDDLLIVNKTQRDGSSSCAWQLQWYPGKWTAVSLSGKAFGNQWRDSSRYRSSYRQGHEWTFDGGQERFCTSIISGTNSRT